MEAGDPNLFGSQRGTQTPQGHTSHPDLHISPAPPCAPRLRAARRPGPAGTARLRSTDNGISIDLPRAASSARAPHASPSAQEHPPAPQLILVQCPGPALPPEGRKVLTQIYQIYRVCLKSEHHLPTACLAFWVRLLQDKTVSFCKRDKSSPGPKRAGLSPKASLAPVTALPLQRETGKVQTRRFPAHLLRFGVGRCCSPEGSGISIAFLRSPVLVVAQCGSAV